MTTSPVLLQADGLRKTYPTGTGELVAVDDLSFALHAGGALGIVGESGSGKTTTARMLVGLEAPDSGEILLQGRPLATRTRGRAARLARAKAVQIVFQDPYLSLDARLTIGATLDAVLRLHGHADRTAQAGSANSWPRSAWATARRPPCPAGSPADSVNGPR